jgi:hypothetical protein
MAVGMLRESNTQWLSASTLAVTLHCAMACCASHVNHPCNQPLPAFAPPDALAHTASSPCHTAVPIKAAGKTVPRTLDRVVHGLQALLGDLAIVPQHTPVVVMVAWVGGGGKGGGSEVRGGDKGGSTRVSIQAPGGL